MRCIGIRRWTAIAATTIAMVPTLERVAGRRDPYPKRGRERSQSAAMIAMVEPRARGWAAAALLAASLSRYETWPACAVLASLCGVATLRGRQPRRNTIIALVAVAGPTLWMLWNAHAHGSPVHFLARVSAFRRAIGAAELPLRDKLLTFPIALAAETRVAAMLEAVGVVGLCSSGALRRRWLVAGYCVVATMAFLVLGDVRDGCSHAPSGAVRSLRSGGCSSRWASTQSTTRCVFREAAVHASASDFLLWALSRGWRTCHVPLEQTSRRDRSRATRRTHCARAGHAKPQHVVGRHHSLLVRALCPDRGLGPAGGSQYSPVPASAADTRVPARRGALVLRDGPLVLRP